MTAPDFQVIKYNHLKSIKVDLV